MSWPLARDVVAGAFVDACRLEVRSLKPGNVHTWADGHRMTVEDFDRSAEAAAPFLADPALSVGQRVRRAVEATFAAVGTNTNLGILLLCAPLASAADRPEMAAAHPHGPARAFGRRLMMVMEGLDHADAVEVYRAIARANPAGLGATPDGDVALAPPADWTLRDAMRAAADRDLIAYEYATDFSVVTAQMEQFRRRLAAGVAPEWALAECFLTLLATRPDTHIVRKHGAKAAEDVVRRARASADRILASGASDLSTHADDLLRLDSSLKSDGLNPGSLADISAALVFLSNLLTAAGARL